MLFPLIKNNIEKIRSFTPIPIIKTKKFWNIEGVQAGNLSVILAETEEQINNAKRLRYQVFFEEMGAIPTPEAKARKIDEDEFDDYCDHLIVLDKSITNGNPVVGTYRLLRKSQAKKIGRFYSESEYEIDRLAKVWGEILELGRSCVHEKYRTRAVMQLLWRGIATYVFKHKIKVMFGCASFPGIDVNQHKAALSYLYHNHLAPEKMCTKALDSLYVKMDWLSKEESSNKRIAANLPPLIKGYLRLGGFIGNGAVIDYKCNTTDVSIILQTKLVTDKYINRYRPEE